MAEKTVPNLRFEGSVWCNMDIALRNVEQTLGRDTRTMGLSVIELYILRALYQHDGQYASELAHAVGRAATSFTPNLDKLQEKDMIERRADPRDRRAVRIHLTPEAHKRRDEVLEMAKQLDERLAAKFERREFEVFLRVLSQLQTVEI
jgi:MarR family transcriptional regulator, organic hydroperoxide resistance regulator